MGWKTVPAEPDPAGDDDDDDWDSWGDLSPSRRSEPPSTIPLSEAKRWLKEYQKRRGHSHPRYHKSSTPRDEFSESREFLDHSLVKHAIHVRQGYYTRTDPGFRLEQWMKTNEYLRQRWPSEADKKAPRNLVIAVCEALGYSDIP
jgi:hypothetical protein